MRSGPNAAPVLVGGGGSPWASAPEIPASPGMTCAPCGLEQPVQPQQASPPQIAPISAARDIPRLSSSSRYLDNSFRSSFISLCFCIFNDFFLAIELTVNRSNRAAFQIFVDTFIERSAINTQRLMSSFGRTIDIFIRVRETHHERWAYHAAPNQFLHKQRAKWL